MKEQTDVLRIPQHLGQQAMGWGRPPEVQAADGRVKLSSAVGICHIIALSLALYHWRVVRSRNHAPILMLLYVTSHHLLSVCPILNRFLEVEVIFFFSLRTVRYEGTQILNLFFPL